MDSIQPPDSEVSHIQKSPVDASGSRYRNVFITLSSTQRKFRVHKLSSPADTRYVKQYDSARKQTAKAKLHTLRIAP
ncbi:hypothetical protein EVG20_g3663 [Dentipellis fragilis]|uniref:Uncharacterized protein n=1 Tax=Dentipellis fragilis TaxID=205917 RepID=A0A4Y9Z2D8_9AGAM|nr:hypothetical protein EVG20_g3663 [Dentipellis fragilis]